VTLVISRGKERIAVPKVVDRDEDEAKSALEAAGFTVTVEREESTDADPGKVLSQSPEAGKRSVKGSSVTIKVAKEPAEAEVPAVVGRPENEAIEELSGAGFTVRTVEQPVDSPDQDGIVLKQAPAAGKAKKGSRVTITVGRFDPNLNPDPGTETTTTP
jgi:serine/threonine-protein kinase